MEHLTCFYHPNREATQKCSKCGKLICLECQTTVRTTSSGTSNIALTRMYCPECGKTAKNIRKVSMIVAFSLIIIIGIVTFTVIIPNLL